jgi:hypothetical protein
VKRAALLAGLALLAGCGADEEKAATTATTPRTPTTIATAPPALTRADAVLEADSVASQEAFRRDFSFPPDAFDTTCRSIAPVNGRARYACRFRSPKDACTGAVQISELADGSRTSAALRIKCRGEPNI